MWQTKLTPVYRIIIKMYGSEWCLKQYAEGARDTTTMKNVSPMFTLIQS